MSHCISYCNFLVIAAFKLSFCYSYVYFVSVCSLVWRIWPDLRYWHVKADDDDEEEIAEASEAKIEMEKAETMQKIKDINKLENRDKDITLYEHGENIKNNQQKGIFVILGSALHNRLLIESTYNRLRFYQCFTKLFLQLSYIKYILSY